MDLFELVSSAVFLSKLSLFSFSLLHLLTRFDLVVLHFPIFIGLLLTLEISQLSLATVWVRLPFQFS